jgi:hypothetical protein
LEIQENMKKLQVGLLLLLLGIVLAAFSGKYLIVNQPEKSDAILVLAGETDQRPARGLELMG